MKQTFKGGLEVVDWRFTFGTHPYQRCLWILDLNWATIFKFTKNRVIQYVNFYLIVDLFILGLVPTGLFTVKRFVSLVFWVIISCLI